ncbi:hypothetical protein [Streptomyces mirabilis]|uniref:hypothetical protein n=1 Tax=Streptomyces mirabilis TaxID=68239 RepID=UPI0033DCC05D
MADVPDGLDETHAVRFTTLLAGGNSGKVLMRTMTPGATPGERVCGWRIGHHLLVPLTAGEVFGAYCTDISGDLIGPDSGVDYCAGFDLPGGTGQPAHGH